MKGDITTQILKEVDADIELKIKKPVDPQEFFTNGHGLYVYDSFEERALPKAKRHESPLEFHLESHELMQGATDVQIEESLDHKNVFGDADVSAIVADLILKQEKGKKGPLLTNGYANLFYTASCVVSVYWHDDEWGVHAYGRDVCAWFQGIRVFSPRN